MKFGRLGKPLAILAVLLGLVVSVGTGATVVAMKVTTDPMFCASCHIMEPYVKSWQESSHNHVPCVDCHYEPGLLETMEGKFKALSQLAKYVTRTQGTKPWAEVSDYSCMRAGCHSDRLLEGEIQFGRIRFDHRHHLIGERRGMTLRCTSCHSQIVQGDHLTVTTTTCILCHFKPGTTTKPIDDCARCHGPPTDVKQVGGFAFQHSEYLERGVGCATCHGDVTRGTGEVPRQRCGTCHNKQEHLERYGDLEFVHRHHVKEHSVACQECHTQMQHGLPPRETHVQGDCKTCHTGTHEAGANLYRGTGGAGVADDPSAMFLARVTCNGCHRAPFPGAPAPAGASTYAADPLACVDCHGVGFDGMAQRWQDEVRESAKAVQANVQAAADCLAGARGDGAALAEAKRRYEAAAKNLGIVLLDKSDGVHNPTYARSLLRKADEDARAVCAALDPKRATTAAPVGPRAASKDGCTTLCHVGVETKRVTAAKTLGGIGFPHGPHLSKAGLDCSKCHDAATHGKTIVRRADCASCHHEKDTATDRCVQCHVEVADLRAKTPEGRGARTTVRTMEDLDCETCHDSLAKGHSREAVAASCVGCHEDDADAVEKQLDRWRTTWEEPLKAVEAALATAPEDVAKAVRSEVEALRRAGPQHNVPWSRAVAARLLERLRSGR